MSVRKYTSHTSDHCTPVPETILKNRKRHEANTAARAEAAGVMRAAMKANRVQSFKSAEKYIKEYRATERALIGLRRQAKANGSFFVEPEAKMILVVRIKGINGVNPKVKKVLQLLRLRQINNAVFLRVNKATLNMLKIVESYVAYGEPTLKTVRDLCYKRGYAKVDGNRIPIVDNMVIEQNLGRFGVSCMEDLVHEIVTLGPHFTQVNRFMWPFKLSAPKGGHASITHGFVEMTGKRGTHGDQGHFINQMIKSMN
ncbi:ribosomal protein L7, eukaryotic [Kipferlia bialata]|uniref:Ribosomal protein L7, eukaryotic n=1 Tax=Kipferlia bialata TaxID=797122 RepID=A0A9K3GEK8_9EUKA|nr:ribosomal protein L7, eukaryotic [Kipferlia bialata]|eukprot:g19.t1